MMQLILQGSAISSAMKPFNTTPRAGRKSPTWIALLFCLFMIFQGVSWYLKRNKPDKAGGNNPATTAQNDGATSGIENAGDDSGDLSSRLDRIANDLAEEGESESTAGSGRSSRGRPSASGGNRNEDAEDTVTDDTVIDDTVDSDPTVLERAIAEGDYDVDRVVDGDTLVLENGARMRMVGIDCPESVKPDSPVEPFGPEASRFTKDSIKRQKNRVRLTLDSIQQQDRYGRELAYVWLDDGTLLNEELVRLGLARVLRQLDFDSPMRKRLIAAESEARGNKRGIWSDEAR